VRTVVDIDENGLREARAALGTTTKVETVNRALAEVAALAGASARSQAPRQR